MVDEYTQDEAREAIEAFYFAYRAFTARPDRILEQRELGRAHHRILYFVGRHPGMSVGALLATLEVSKQALNAPLRQLLEMQLVTAESDPQDRRAKRLRLTAEGEALEARLTGTQTQQLAAVFKSLPSAERQAWLAIMRGLAEA